MANHTRYIEIWPGDRFGRGVVVEEIRIPDADRPYGVRGARLLCDCGTAYEARLSSLRQGRTTSCGCLRREGRAPEHVITPGDRFGRGVVIGETRASSRRGARLLCDCGTVYEAQLSDLRRGHTTSCGCLQREMAQAHGSSPANLERLAAHSRSPDGQAIRAAMQRGNITHGLAGHPLYVTWQNMMRRCYSPGNKAYRNYGGRGITVCDRWHDVAAFVADIMRLLGPRPDGMTLDRWPDNDGNYEPGNVRWATREQQRANMRKPAA
jgi:hypothetical protein